ncbi:hypothetical protein QW180_16130 [Vibrio sinaloensis]|nr:hypothetical protein [Vibrio sinaloensis]
MKTMVVSITSQPSSMSFLDVAKAQGSAMPVRDYEVVYSVNHQFQLLRDF